jgi:hypothetical protein
MKANEERTSTAGEILATYAEGASSAAWIPSSEPSAVPVSRAAKGAAEQMRESILVAVARFEEGLNADQEAGGCFVTSAHGTVRIREVCFSGSSLIVFRGMTDTGALAEVVQSVFQVNLMLVALPKQGPVARRMGFVQR